jgi:DNA-directed RNA polymerase specialized sigma24 family protein
MVQVVLVRVVIEAAARKRHFESIPFLCGFCRKVLLSQLGKREKRRSRERSTPDADLNASPAETDQPKDVEDMLFYLSLLVDARHRTVLSLRYVDGLTFSRIGSQLGCAESQAHKLHESALGELRRRLVR